MATRWSGYSYYWAIVDLYWPYLTIIGYRVVAIEAIYAIDIISTSRTSILGFNSTMFVQQRTHIDRDTPYAVHWLKEIPLY